MSLLFIFEDNVCECDMNLKPVMGESNCLIISIVFLIISIVFLNVAINYFSLEEIANCFLISFFPHNSNIASKWY